MHALLMMLAVPGALAGAVIFQWFFGYNFSVAVVSVTSHAVWYRNWDYHVVYLRTD